MKKLITLVFTLGYLSVFSQESKEIQKLKSETGATVTMSKSTLNPNFIRFSDSERMKFKSSDAKSIANEFLTQNLNVFNLKSDQEMVFVSEETDNYGLKNVIYKQYYHGIPVYDGILKFHFNQRNQLTSINGNVISNIKVNATPNITNTDAENIAKQLIDEQKLNQANLPLEITKNNLIVFPKNLVQGGIVVPYLTYEIEITNKNNVREFLYVNAHTGALVEQFTGIHPIIDRKLYETSVSASNLKWQEGDPFPGTLTIWQQNEVVTSEHVYNFFKNAFGYISYGNNDQSMVTINNNPNISCPNANWNGSTANYCTGTAADDVVAHEWGHAYTSYTSGLIYQYQSGALNESYSDVWGETIDLLNNYQDSGENLSVRTTTSCIGSLRWKMGEDATAFGGAIRDMWYPPCKGDPAKVLDDTNYYCGTADSGGVHTNSGVTNHLYALLVDGGTYNGYTISGIGFVKAAHLWWRAQYNYLISTSDFASFADALEASCTDLVGINLQGLSTTSTPAGLSGQSFTTSDLQNIQNAILAVQLRGSLVIQCGFGTILGQTSILCSGATTGALFKETWENGTGNWVITNIPNNPASWINRNWQINSTLPKGRAGSAIFAIDPANGNCTTSLQNGILRLESPIINFPTFTTGKYEMAFNHYVATESTWDGGNIKYSLNNGPWTLVPSSAFTQNTYNDILDNSTSNDNPLKGQNAFTGTDGGSLSGSWGQSIIDLSILGVTSGSNIKFRFELGTDGCGGLDGWYLDEIYVFNCNNILEVKDIEKMSGISIYPNPTSGILTIKNDDHLKINSLEFYNTAGQLVKAFSLENKLKSNDIDITSFESGVFMLKIKTEKETISVKVIKK